MIQLQDYIRVIRIKFGIVAGWFEKTSETFELSTKVTLASQLKLLLCPSLGLALTLITEHARATTANDAAPIKYPFLKKVSYDFYNISWLLLRFLWRYLAKNS